METVVLFIIQKLEEDTFFPKKEGDCKVVEEGFNREYNLRLMLISGF